MLGEVLGEILGEIFVPLTEKCCSRIGHTFEVLETASWIPLSVNYCLTRDFRPFLLHTRCPLNTRYKLTLRFHFSPIRQSTILLGKGHHTERVLFE